MSKGKYFLKTLEKAIYANEAFLNDEKIELVSPCCDGNRVAHADGDFVCDKIKVVLKGKKRIAYFFTAPILDEAPAKEKPVKKKTAKKVTKKTAKKVTKKTAKKV